MRSWHLAPHPIACGYQQGCDIQPHEPYCLIEGKGWKKIRCATHAGDPAPANLEPPPQYVGQDMSGFTSMKKLASSKPVLAFDAKAKQARNDE